MEVDQTFTTFVKVGNGLKYTSVNPNNVIAGDTDSVYIDLGGLFDSDANPAEVIRYADELGEQVNDTFDDILGIMFNAPEHKRSIINTEREAVSDKSVFFGKKKYVMHIIDMEGNPVDKNKFMGVEIIKSDTPIVIQDFLREVVDLIINKESYESVKKYVDGFKKQYYNMSMIEIGRPTGIKVLNKYYDMFDRQLKLLGVYDSAHGVQVQQGNPLAGIPYHAKAAIIYNMKCGESDIEIRAGDKMRITYVKDEPYKAIGVPADLESHELPEFINGIDIDYDFMWSKVLTKLELYLTPIGYDITARQAEQTKNFFF